MLSLNGFTYFILISFINLLTLRIDLRNFEYSWFLRKLAVLKLIIIYLPLNALAITDHLLPIWSLSFSNIFSYSKESLFSTIPSSRWLLYLKIIKKVNLYRHCFPFLPHILNSKSIIFAIELHFFIFLYYFNNFNTLSYSTVQPRRIDIW